MSYTATVQRVRQELKATFATLDRYFAVPEAVQHYRPAAEAWTIAEILEHVTLTNHFLMVTLSQSRDKVLRRAQEQPLPAGESDLDAILRIGNPDAFAWGRPEHMQPTGTKTLAEVRQTLHAQEQECLTILEQIQNGEGALHQVRMSVQNLGKLDMYQWLYFLVQHVARHAMEIERLLATQEAQQAAGGWKPSN